MIQGKKVNGNGTRFAIVVSPSETDNMAIQSLKLLISFLLMLFISNQWKGRNISFFSSLFDSTKF